MDRDRKLPIDLFRLCGMLSAEMKILSLEGGPMTTTLVADLQWKLERANAHLAMLLDGHPLGELAGPIRVYCEAWFEYITYVGYWFSDPEYAQKCSAALEALASAESELEKSVRRFRFRAAA
jgi:hypothetical protein